MDSYSTLGICATVAIVPIVLLLPHFPPVADAVYPMIGLLFSISVPIIYDRLKQHRKRTNIRSFLRKYLKLVRDIQEVPEELRKIVLGEIITDLGNLAPYIQNAHDGPSYVAFMSAVARLEQLAEEDSSMQDLYDLTLETVRNLKR